MANHTDARTMLVRADQAPMIEDHHALEDVPLGPAPESQPVEKLSTEKGSVEKMSVEKTSVEEQPVEKQRVTLHACFLGLVASIGGFMFGYVR